MPSSSLFLRSSATLFSFVSFISTSFAAPHELSARQATTPNYSYTLAKTYAGSTFFSENDWNYFSDADPTHGFVTYGNKAYADQNRLISFDGDYAVIKVDSTTKIGNGNKNYYRDTQDYTYKTTNGIGRKSVRIEGKYEFTHGLIITDVGQMPSGICGTWPAFWTLGQNWPNNGEIDIIEGANAQSGNWMSLHTGSASNISGNTDSFSAKLTATDCNVNINSPNPNYTGCKFEDPDAATYASYKGGVWATQWTSDRIKIWYWPYGKVPADVTNGSPQPGSSWGTPRSSFAPPQNLRADANFKGHHVIFDTTFCGDLGDNTWPQTCKASTGYDTCADYVANEPSAFANAQWKVKYVKIYSEGAVATTSTTSSKTSSTTSSSTTSKPSTTTSSSSSVTTTTSSKPVSTTSTTTSSASPSRTSSTTATSSKTSSTTSSTSSTITRTVTTTSTVTRRRPTQRIV